MPGIAANNNPSEDVSAYKGPYTGNTVKLPGGSFDHFETTVNTTHLQYGYWKFQSIKDDQRAYKRGFTTPDDVLLAQNDDDDTSPYEDISLQWIPGSKDHNLKRLKARINGPASMQLQTLAELKVALGQPLALRGQIPTYPTGDDDRLRAFWDSRFRKRATTRLASETPKPVRPVSSPRNLLATTSLNRTPAQQLKIHPKSQIPLASITISKDINVPNSAPSKLVADAAASKPLPTPSLPLKTPRRNNLHADRPIDKQSIHNLHVLRKALHRSDATSAGGDRIRRIGVVCGAIKAASPKSLTPRSNTIYDSGRADSVLPPSLSVARAPDAVSIDSVFNSVDSIDTLNNEYSRADGLSNILTCVDCGELSFHRWNCTITHIVEEEQLTPTKLTSLAEATEFFDPGPWTSHLELDAEIAWPDGVDISDENGKELDMTEIDDDSAELMIGLSPECIAREAAIISSQLKKEHWP